MVDVVVTTKHVELQSNRYHQQTNTQLFTGQVPFLSPSQQGQSTEESFTWKAIIKTVSTTKTLQGALVAV